MSKFKKHKRLYYVPGIISLIVIPLVLWHYGMQYIAESDFRVIKFNMPPKDFYDNEEIAEFVKDIKYDEFKVPVNFSDKTELTYIKLIEKLKEENIDKTGIRFQFTELNTYGDMVKLLSIMEKTEQGRYGFKFEENVFEVIHIKKNENDVMMCGTSYTIRTISDLGDEDRTRFEIMISDFKDFVKNIPKSSYPIIVGYFVLVICSIFRPKIFILYPLKS